MIAWHLLSREEEYAFTRPSLVREKVRALQPLIGTGPARGNPGGSPIWATRRQRNLEQLDLVRQAERAYARLVKDWQPAIKKGAGAAPGRASLAVERQAARQETAPPPALQRTSKLSFLGLIKPSALPPACQQVTPAAAVRLGLPNPLS